MKKAYLVLIRLLAAQAVRAHLAAQSQQQSGVERKCTNQPVQIPSELA